MEKEIIVVGTSLGGLAALRTLLENLPLNFAFPVAVVQHRSVECSDLLLRELRRHIPLPLLEPADYEPILPGRIYIAPADYHLLIERGEFRLSTEGPVRYARPSIDVLFESAADDCGSRSVGIILTGASEDGAQGAVRIKQVGGTLIVQNPEEAECAVMPRATLNAVAADYVYSLSEIRSYLGCLQTAAR